jgi:PAS domain S-box-containing protein
MDIPSPLTDAVNGLPDAAFLVGDDGVILTANIAATKMFGYSHGQLIGSQVDDLMPQSARGYHQSVREGAVADRKPRSFTSGTTFECERRGGELFQADINLSPTVVDGVQMTWALVRDLDGPTEANTGRRQALTALDAIGRMAASTFDLQKDFASVAARLNEVVPHDRIVVSLVREDDSTIADVSFVAGDVPRDYPVGTEIKVAETAIAWMQRSGQPVSFVCDQIEYAPPTVQTGLSEGYTETYCVPLFDGDEIVGSVIAGTKNPRKYSEFHKHLMSRMGDHLAVAIVNQRMRARVQAQADEIRLIGDIGQMVSSSTDLNEAFAAAEDLIRVFVHFDRLAIYSIDFERGSMTRSLVLGERLDASDSVSFSLSKNGVEYLDDLLTTRRSLHLRRDEIAEFAKSNEVFIPLVKAGYEQLLLVPLIVTQQPVGFMVFSSKSTDEYSGRELAIASRISEKVAGSVSSSFRFDQTLRESEIESILVDIGNVVGSTLELQSIEKELGPLLRKLVPGNSIMITGVTEDGQHLRVFYMDYVGVEPEPELTPGPDLVALHPIKGTTSEGVLKNRKPVVVNASSGTDFEKNYPGAGAAHAGGGLRSVINVPLIASDEVFGFLTYRSNSSDDYDIEQVRLVERIALQLASSVAFVELRRRDDALHERRTALASIQNVMGSALNLSDVWTEFTELLGGIIDFDTVNLVAVNNDALTATVKFGLNRSMMPAGLHSVSDDFELANTITGHVVRSGTSYVFNNEDVRETSEFLPNAFADGVEFSWNSNMAVPLVWGGNVVACLHIHGFGKNGYLSDDLDFAEQVAARIAGPVAGNLLREHASSLAQEREVLVKIRTLMSSGGDVSEVFDEVVVLINQIIAIDAMNLYEIIPDQGEIMFLASWSDENWLDNYSGYAGPLLLKGTLVEAAIEERKGVVRSIVDPAIFAAEFPGTPSSNLHTPPRSSIAVPLIWGDEIVAVLWMTRLGDIELTNEEVATAERIAAQIAGPVAGVIVRRQELELTDERQRRVAAELEAATLAELNETKSNFVGAMSHELKTPLTSIVAFSDILSRNNEKGLEGRALQQVKVIQRNARHLEGMINELLDLSRMESGRFAISKMPFDFSSLVSDSLESSQPQFEAMSQAVNFEISSDVLLVNGDRDRLLQVVNNLLNNASKYSPEGSDIEIAIREDDRWLVVEVSDRGPGIPEENPEGLFEMFHRADNEITRRVPGTGIGLHVSKRIIDEHGGEIVLETREGGGAVAKFRIPIGVNALS